MRLNYHRARLSSYNIVFYYFTFYYFFLSSWSFLWSSPAGTDQTPQLITSSCQSCLLLLMSFIFLETLSSAASRLDRLFTFVFPGVSLSLSLSVCSSGPVSPTMIIKVSSYLNTSLWALLNIHSATPQETRECCSGFTQVPLQGKLGHLCCAEALKEWRF